MNSTNKNRKVCFKMTKEQIIEKIKNYIDEKGIEFTGELTEDDWNEMADEIESIAEHNYRSGKGYFIGSDDIENMLYTWYSDIMW